MSKEVYSIDRYKESSYDPNMYVTNLVATWDCGNGEVIPLPAQCANLTQETREKFVTDLAAISRGKTEAKNPAGRFKALLNEAAPAFINPNVMDEKLSEGSPSRPLEFLPIMAVFQKMEDLGVTYYKIPMGSEDSVIDEEYFLNTIVKYSFVTPHASDLDGNIQICVHTNLRTLLNADIPYKDIPYADSILYKVTNGYIQYDGEAVPVTEIDNRLLIETYGNYVWLSLDVMLNKPDTTEEDKRHTLTGIIKDVNNGNAIIMGYADFKAVKVSSPMFSWSQWPMTHTMLSKESQSDRVAENNKYWLPEDIVDVITKYVEEHTKDLKPGELMPMTVDSLYVNIAQQIISDALWPQTPNLRDRIVDKFIKQLPMQMVQDFLKALGYKREIYSRAPYYFKYKECIVTGWDITNFNTIPTMLSYSPWHHSTLERNVHPYIWKNWTQSVTTEVLEMVRYCINTDDNDVIRGVGILTPEYLADNIKVEDV